MQTNNRQESVVNYYVLCSKLKDLIRSGWKKWKVDRERLESVAEHIFGVQSLAIAMCSQYQYDIDIYKVIFMLAVHELEEISIGDLTLWDTTAENKLEQGHLAIEKILSDLLYKEDIKKIILEFDERKTKEAIFAYHCDKLECDLQCKLYDEEGCVDMNNQSDNPVYHDRKVQSIIKDGDSSWSSMWLEFDRSKYDDDSNFMEVLDYVKNNNIGLKKKKLVNNN